MNKKYKFTGLTITFLILLTASCSRSQAQTQGKDETVKPTPTSTPVPAATVQNKDKADRVIRSIIVLNLLATLCSEVTQASGPVVNRACLKEATTCLKSINYDSPDPITQIIKCSDKGLNIITEVQP